MSNVLNNYLESFAPPKPKPAAVEKKSEPEQEIPKTMMPAWNNQKQAGINSLLTLQNGGQK